MSAYEEMSVKTPRRLSPIWFLVLTLLLFATTLTVIAMIEAGRAESNSSEESDLLILTRVWNHFKTGAENDTEIATVERIARDAGNGTNPNPSLAEESRNFYEEQRAVVVNSQSMDPVMGQRQDAYGPPQGREESYDQDPYYDVADDYGPGRYPYPESKQESEEDERFYDKDDSSAGTEEGRSSQARPYDAYYAPWSHGQRPAPVPVATHGAAEGNNRKLQATPNRSPYPAYDEVYDYPMGFQPRPRPESELAKQSQSTPDNSVAQVQSESTLVTVLKSLKQIWDLYQALMGAWNAVSERHQQSTEKFRQEQAAKQAEKNRLRQQQQKTRINSKKPPSVEGNKKNQTKKTHHNDKKSATTTTSAPDSSEEEEEKEAEHSEKKVEKVDTVTPSPPSTKIEAIKGENGNLRSVRGLRHRRNAEEEEKGDTDVGEGRYIKGDPLKGYYDFVITEGSYKFWAVFQVGTALLIIYSTFAAIYYSKVNPLTSDYDYTDYLGGVRSLSGGDADFVDDGDAATPPASTTSNIMKWLPQTAHSIKFILDAIDKVPLDLDKDKEPGWSTGKRIRRRA
ncbi:uncharacterized protein LOC108104036 [Drosophila eugracilis]|uniref:uncharacterized protein LOC108104036 n=1 Tax=Drosophila eugracilis TaxID=29029 RepID=UPI001BDAF087|nr:uncharacterized protein LOC108104036 [Drosophila eugracilis]